MYHVRTCLWFDGDALEAAELYTALLPGSGITRIVRTAPDVPPVVVEFHLAGTPYQALNADRAHGFSEVASIAVQTVDQQETDRLWDGLIAQGGIAGRCGWLTDRFGLSWQIIPEAVPRLLASPDRVAADRVMQALLQMEKISIPDLNSAFAA